MVELRYLELNLRRSLWVVICWIECFNLIFLDMSFRRESEVGGVWRVPLSVDIARDLIGSDH
jgi:hypothetical protein